MNEWLKNLLAKIKELWGKWKPVQKAILIGVVAVVVIAIFATFRFSSAPSMVRIFNAAITDQQARDNIAFRLDEENVKYTLSDDGYFSVEDAATARKMRTLLETEGLVPKNMDPFAFFDTQRWNTTDIERNINLQRAIKLLVEQHLESLDDIVDANVVITAPEKALFTEEQKPVTASITLTFRPGSDYPTNRTKLRGLQNLILRAIVGLTEENLTIADSAGNILNDFEGMSEINDIDIAAKKDRLKRDIELQLSTKALNTLRANFNSDRVRDVAVTIEMDMMSKDISDKTIYTPIIITEQDIDKPYDTTEKRDYLPLSSQTITKEWTGTGYNPKGPSGVEGQNPPVYSDMSNVIGKSTETAVTQNNVMNQEVRHTERSSAADIQRLTASANIDGYWEKETDGRNTPVFLTEKNYNELFDRYSARFEDLVNNPNIRFRLGHIIRIYRPVSDDTLSKAGRLVEDAIGYNRARGDSVTITSWPIPREEEWDAEDAEILRKENTQRTIIMILAGTAAVLVAFIIFRLINRELERRRRQKEEELLRRQQMEREKALWEANQSGMEVSMTVEERKRAELQENAIAMAKEHPEDVAMLLRTWLMED